MKRRIKHLLLLISVFAILLSLTSCMTSTDGEYTEWAFSKDLSVLTNGTKEYTPYTAQIPTSWIVTGNNAYYYGGTATQGNVSAEITRPLDDDNILCVYIKENVWSKGYAKLYTTHTGASTLQYTSNVSIYSKTYLLDTEKEEQALLTDSTKEVIGDFDLETSPTLDIETYLLNDYDKIEVVSYTLGGFLKHVHGVFYFNRGHVYYLDLDEVETDVYDADGYLDDEEDYYTLYHIGESERNILDANCDALSPIKSNIEFESPVTVEEDAGANAAVAKVILTLVTVFFGIVIPAVPMTLSLITAIKKKWVIEIIDYVQLFAGAVWMICGIVIFILILL